MVQMMNNIRQRESRDRKHSANPCAEHSAVERQVGDGDFIDAVMLRSFTGDRLHGLVT